MVWIAMMMADEPPSEGCAVEVVGIPVAAMGHHRLEVGDGDDRELSASVVLGPLSAPIRLRVLGPRYRGERTVAPAECGPGSRVRLQVVPLPARLSFQCAPDGLTVECTGCPESFEGNVYLAEEFPALPMSAMALEVELLLRAPGFRRQTVPLRLYPGPNAIAVQLDPLSR